MKLIILLTLLYSCLQFNEEVEVSSPSPSNSPSIIFKTPAGTLDTRSFYTIDLKSIKEKYSNCSKVVVFNKANDTKISLNRKDLEKHNQIRIRKFSDQYLVRLETQKGSRIYPLKKINGVLSL